jgi:leucyl-tRNA synthetase
MPTAVEEVPGFDICILKARALEFEKIKEQIQGKNIVKIIVVPQKLINIVAK